MLTAHPALRRRHLLDRILSTNGTVVICGPTGSGKTTLARQLKLESTREIVDTREVFGGRNQRDDFPGRDAVIVGPGLVSSLNDLDLWPDLILAGPDLWFTEEETTELSKRTLGDRRDLTQVVESILAHTSGWPWAVLCFLDILERRPDADPDMLVETQHPYLQKRVFSLLDRLPLRARRETQIAARFTEIHPEYFSAKTGSIICERQ